MCSRERTEEQSTHPIAMSAKHPQRCCRHPTPPPPNAADEVGRRPSPPPPQQSQRPPSCHQCCRSPPSRGNAMEGPSSRAPVSASGMRLQECLPSAQPHDATKDDTVVASPTEQHPLKPSPLLPRGGCLNECFIWKGGNPFLFFRLSNVEMESIHQSTFISL